MKIFPLSTLGKLTLIIIAIVLGLMTWMMWRPQDWAWYLNRTAKGRTFVNKMQTPKATKKK